MADNRPRVWNRIPKFFVDQRVQNFINQHQITNCFGFVEDENYLRLKCWKDNILTDVDRDGTLHGLNINMIKTINPFLGKNY